MIDEPKLGGWVCMDDDAFEILGWGETFLGAKADAFEVIRDMFDAYLTEDGIEIHLRYYQVTEAVMAKIRKSGTESINGKFVRWKGKDVLALKEEDIAQRCQKTPDMFD